MWLIRRKVWTSAEEKILINIYTKYTLKELGTIFNCKPSAVSTKATELGLKRKTDF